MKLRQSQCGAVLIISMIILLLLTILGVTSMRTTQLEERMAGNARDRHIAFEAAEAALIDAETFISAPAQLGLIPNEYTLNAAPFDLDGTDGLYSDDPSLQNIVQNINWDATDSIGATNIGTGEGISTPPRYIIQLLAPGSQSAGGFNDASTGGGYDDGAGSENSVPASTLVRITARGTGSSDNSVVILQTVFGL